MTTNEGLNILLHIGIDTVKLNGEGFEPLVADQQSVRAGQPLIRFDLGLVREKAASPCTLFTIVNSTRIAAHTMSPYKQVTAGKEIVFTVQLQDDEGGEQDV
jgi:phosphotransferase system IIA component